MSFQTQLSPMRSPFQGTLVHIPPAHVRRVPRAQAQVQALGAMQSVPVIVEAMKIGFMYGALPGVIKGAWDVQQAMAQPLPTKPLTDVGKSVIVSNQAALYGASGALIGLCTGVLATQCNVPPDAVWQAGTATALCLGAVMVGVSKQLWPSPFDADKSAPTMRDLGDEEQCELPETRDVDLCDDTDDQI